MENLCSFHSLIQKSVTSFVNKPLGKHVLLFIFSFVSNNFPFFAQMAQIKNYACDMCNNNKLREPDGIDKFLIGLSAEDEEDKHKLVLENVDATCQFLVWLGHTIAKTEKDDSNVDGKSVDPHVDFALELMLYLSRVGCELDGLQQAYDRVLLHKSNHHILFHFNRTLYKGCASMKHLAILV